MKFKHFSEQAQFYQTRFAYQAPCIQEKLVPDTRLIVVIPCHNEPQLLATLQSLAQCQAPRFPVEVLVVINHGQKAAPDIVQQNQQSLADLKTWEVQKSVSWLSVKYLYVSDLPPKHSGVGLARKIGMDEALHRFQSINYDGGIVCLDADCLVAPNYLKVLETAFLENTFSASIYFEHRLDQSARLNEGIVQYELFLRYYVQALAYSGYPFSFHTIGSSMAVRASIYASTGGMNKRKAGEDFYFLHKVAPQGNFREISETTVFPSARISDRVPFGTGKAQQQWLQNSNGNLLVYSIQVFEAIKVFLEKAPQFFQIHPQTFDKLLTQCQTGVQAFLAKEGFWEKIEEINNHTAQLASFEKRFWAWLDGLKILKLVHFLTDNYYPKQDLAFACQALCKQAKGKGLPNDTSLETYLSLFRKWDKERGKSSHS